jgi:hypothetical protein
VMMVPTTVNGVSNIARPFDCWFRRTSPLTRPGPTHRGIARRRRA